MFSLIFNNLAIGTIIVIVTILVHAVGLYALSTAQHRISNRFQSQATQYGGGTLVVGIILGVLFFHTIEVWIWGIAYFLLGVVNDFETALYFSTTTFTTLGYGDIVLDSDWRLMAVLESANGVLLFGWSTAYIFTTLSHITNHKKK